MTKFGNGKSKKLNKLFCFLLLFLNLDNKYKGIFNTLLIFAYNFYIFLQYINY